MKRLIWTTIKINFRELWCENVDGIHQAQDMSHFFMSPEVHSSQIPTYNIGLSVPLHLCVLRDYLHPCLIIPEQIPAHSDSRITYV
jgi:hypothetical protein